jgi:hypothetical protein
LFVGSTFFAFKKRKLSACCLWFWFSFFPIKQVSKSWDFLIILIIYFIGFGYLVMRRRVSKSLWVGVAKRGLVWVCFGNRTAMDVQDVG